MADSSDNPLGAVLAMVLVSRGEPADLSSNIVGAVVTVVSIATIATFLRFYVRRFLLRQWGVDDWAAMLSYALVLATGTLIALSTRYGIGKPAAAVDAADHKVASILSKVSIITYQCSVTSIKATFLLQYRRIFPLPRFQRLCDVIFWFILLFGIACILAVSIRCSNPANAWNGKYRGPNCVNMVIFWYTTAAINLITDIIILIMPLPLLRSLCLPRKPKLILIGVFGLGIFTTAISIIRISTLKHAATAKDDTAAASLSAIWAVVELCSGLVCVCVPTLRPLIGSAKRQLSSLRGNKSSTSNVAGSHSHSSSAATEANSARIERALSPRHTPHLSKMRSEMSERTNSANSHQLPRLPSHALEALEEGRGVHREPSGAWTIGTDTDDDCEDFCEDDLPTVLFPPPRSHVFRGSFSTAERSVRSTGGVEDSPVLKGAAEP